MDAVPRSVKRCKRSELASACLPALGTRSDLRIRNGPSVAYLHTTTLCATCSLLWRSMFGHYDMVYLLYHSTQCAQNLGGAPCYLMAIR